MKETTIIRQVMKNWKRQRPELLWWHKIVDPGPYGSDATNERAVDVLACFRGVCVGIEWKLKQNDRAFPLSRVRTGQIKTLCEITIAGGVGFLAIVVYKGPHDKCAYFIPIECWNRAVRVAEMEDRKSIRIEEVFPEWRVEPQRDGSFVNWNLSIVEEAIHARANLWR